MAALERGVLILRLFHAGSPVLTAAAIGSALAIPRASLQRLLGGLVSLGLLERRDAAFSLGPGVLTLGYEYLATQDLVAVADPALRELRDTLKCSTHLAVRDGRKIVYLIRNPSRSGLSSNIGVGSALPAASTLMGRLMLAALSHEERLNLYPDATERAALEPWLEQDHRNAFNASDGFMEPGVAAAAASVFDRDGRVVGAINAVRVASQTGSPGLDIMLRHVRQTAHTVSIRLGAPVVRLVPESISA